MVQSSAGVFYDLSKDSATALTTAATPSDAHRRRSQIYGHQCGRHSTNFTTNATTVGALITGINKDGIAGVTASLTTSGAVGDTANAVASATGLLLSNTNSSVVIAEGTTSLKDTTSGEAAAPTAFTSTKAIETIGYQAGANEQTANLASTDLTSEGNAEAALTQIYDGISNVAAQRGYLGAQVNTLNAISQVVGTQQENVTAAQNAVQATDYASATTALSKYEILSQTGISALAQANSLQQEVTKLLQ